MNVHKVIWQEGMFIGTQHFQQHDRYLENLIDARSRRSLHRRTAARRTCGRSAESPASNSLVERSSRQRPARALIDLQALRHNEDYDRDEGVVTRVKDDIGPYLQKCLREVFGKKIKADALLWCNGRTGNTDALGLENIGVKVNSRGQIEVNLFSRSFQWRRNPGQPPSAMTRSGTRMR